MEELNWTEKLKSFKDVLDLSEDCYDDEDELEDIEEDEWPAEGVSLELKLGVIIDAEGCLDDELVIDQFMTSLSQIPGVEAAWVVPFSEQELEEDDDDEDEDDWE